MSEYMFKNLSEIDNVAEPADGTTVMGFENGTPIQMPMSAVKGSGGVFIIDPDDPEFSTTDTAYGDKIKEAIEIGRVVVYKQTFDAANMNFDENYGMTGKVIAYLNIGSSFTVKGSAGWYLAFEIINDGESELFRVTSGWGGD